MPAESTPPRRRRTNRPASAQHEAHSERQPRRGARFLGEIIEPQRGLLDLRLGELWQYRDLVMLFVRRDFVSVYKQTILGPLWFLIQPLLTTIIFTFIFGSVAKLPTDGLPQFLFYMSGTVVWSYFDPGCGHHVIQMSKVA